MAKPVELLERPEEATCADSPARRLRPPQRNGLERHFAPTDQVIELTAMPVIGRPLMRAMKSRRFQFLAILPNQIIFWVVIFTGLLGTADPNRNFATAVTWFIWFCMVFVMIVGVGRAWCLMCPFGGFGEWVQRLSFMGRRPRSIGLNLKWPQALSRFGVLPAICAFIALTWAEEFWGIAGPGDPRYTSYMVLFIISFALVMFLVFERRTFCRYLCPLTGLIGTVGAVGMAAGLRTRDRDVCLSCETKDCMRGSERGYPCPWYEWPGSATSNLMCGLCTECVKNCPSNNVGFFVQKPLTSVIAPLRRRVDIAWSVLLLFGLVVFQQVNALPIYANLDGWLNSHTGWAYPNPIDFVGFIAAFALVFAGCVWLLRAVLARREPAPSSGVRKTSSFTSWLMPLAYAFIPLTGSDYLARQLPKFWFSAPKVIASISDPFGFGWNIFGTAHWSGANVSILSANGVVISQVIVVGLGALATLYATMKVLPRDMSRLTPHIGWLRVVVVLTVAAVCAPVAYLYVLMGAAT